jgi:hypothetical protein
MSSGKGSPMPQANKIPKIAKYIAGPYKLSKKSKRAFMALALTLRGTDLR